jgi:hypothetical protein
MIDAKELGMILFTIQHDPKIKTIEYIRDDKFTIKITRRFKSYKYPRSTDKHEDMCINSGRPGFLTRKLIAKRKEAGLLFPFINTKPFPIKKSK